MYVAPGLQHNNWSGNPNCAFQNVVDYIEVLVDYIEGGVVSPGLYTASVALPNNRMFSPAAFPELEALFDQLQPLVDSGRVVYATYREVAEIWQESYDSQPTIFPFNQVDPADYTCP